MSETATNPVADDASRVDQPGVADQGVSAQTDDIDTEAFDRMEAPDEDDEPQAEEAEVEASAPGQAEDDDSQEVELEDGRKVRVPKDIAPRLMMHADYTRKTQELAEQRRAHEEATKAWETQKAESLAALPEEHSAVAVLKHNIASVQSQLTTPDNNGVVLGQIDWLAFRAQAMANPDLKPIYDDYRLRYDAARQTLDDLKGNLKAAEDTLKTKEDQRLQAQREQSEKELAARREETGKILAAKIEGWGPEKATAIAKFAIEEAGVEPAEVAEMTDPRVWMILNDAMSLRQEVARLKTALKQNQTAANNSKAQSVKPAEPAKGPSQPSNRLRDDISDDEWMRRRNAQLAKQRA